MPRNVWECSVWHASHNYHGPYLYTQYHTKKGSKRGVPNRPIFSVKWNGDLIGVAHTALE